MNILLFIFNSHLFIKHTTNLNLNIQKILIEMLKLKTYWCMSKKGKLNLAVSKIVCLVIYLVVVWIMKYPLACSCVCELFSVLWGYEQCESSRCNRSKWEYFQSSEAPEQRSGAPLIFLYSHHVDTLLVLIPQKVIVMHSLIPFFDFLLLSSCFLSATLSRSLCLS